MTTSQARPRIAKLAPLLEYLNGLTARAPMADLRERLTAINIEARDLQEYTRFSETTYLRNLVHEGQWYHVLVLCWRSGQRSPIHNHAGSTCGMRVLRGTATETVFKTTPSALVVAANSRDFHEGAVVVSQDADVHQVSNLQTPGEDLITLHVYSPPLLRMDTYSLTDRTVGEWRPMVLEYGFGSGI